MWKLGKLKCFASPGPRPKVESLIQQKGTPKHTYVSQIVVCVGDRYVSNMGVVRFFFFFF